MSKQQSNFTLLQLYLPLKQDWRKENGKEAINATCQIRGVRGTQTGEKKYGKKGGMTGKKLSKETQLIDNIRNERVLISRGRSEQRSSIQDRSFPPHLGPHCSPHPDLLSPLTHLVALQIKTFLFSLSGRTLSPFPPQKIWCSLLRFPAGKPGTDKWPLGAPTDEQSHRLTL